MTKTFLMTILMLILISGTFMLFGQSRQPSGPFEIITVKQCHTYVYTHALETFSIPFLIHDPRSPYTVHEAIHNPAIISEDGRMRMPLELVDIQSTGQLQYDSRTMHSYHYIFRPVFHSDNFSLNIADAQLVFDLENGDSASLNIGAFNYLFVPEEPDWLQLSARYNVHIKIEEIPTASGMVLHIENTRSHPIELSDMSVNCDAIAVDMSELVVYDGAVSAHLEHAQFETDLTRLFMPRSTQETAIVIEAGASKQFFVPFRYVDDTWLLDRYPVVFTLIGEGVRHQQVVDDFQFIRTKWFAAVHPSAHIRHHDTD